MSLTDILVPTAVQMLAALSAWLDKASGFAQERGEEADDLLALRLAPDMYPLAGQVRFAAFMAEEPVHRLRGEPLPEHLEEVRREGWNSGERPGTLVGARSRIDEALIRLRSVGANELDVAADRPIALELPSGIIFDMVGSTYLRDWALPQFYFHLIAAYAILRNHGVALGKIDYVPQMFAYARAGTIPA